MNEKKGKSIDEKYEWMVDSEFLICWPLHCRNGQKDVSLIEATKSLPHKSEEALGKV